MSDVKTFLKVIKKFGYPNPDTLSIAQASSFDVDQFLVELSKTIGDDGVLDFCEKAIHKLTVDEGLRVDLDGPEGNEYVYLHIYPIYYDKKESENDVICKHKWGKSKILYAKEDGEEEYFTIEEIIEDTDMGNWSDLDDLIDTIKGKAYNKIYKNCGFGIWWE